MDLDRLRMGDRIAAVSALLLFIFMFFAWFGAPGEVGRALEQAQELGEQFGVTVPGGEVDTTANAWQAFDFIDMVLLLTVIATIGFAVARAMGTTLSVPASTIVTVLGALSTLLVLYRIIDPPHDASREIGVFLGLLASAGVAFGGWNAMQDEGATFSDAREQFSDAMTADRAGDGPGGSAGPGTASGTRPPSGPSEPPSAPPPPPPPTSGGSGGSGGPGNP